MYHYVRDLKHSRYPNIKGMQTEEFREQIQYLKKNYHFVTVEQVIDAFSSNKQLPEHAVMLTFDDGYADHFNTVFPILQHEGIRGAFYAPVKAITEHTVLDVNKIHFILASTSNEKMPIFLSEIKLLLDSYRGKYSLRSFDEYFSKLAVANRFDSKEVIFVKRLLQVELPEELRNLIVKELFLKIVDVEEEVFSRELYMSMDQIKCMVDCGMHIGSHGYDHYWLGSLSKDKQRYEIQKSIDFIKDVGGDINCWSICYPYGSYNKDTISLLKENGCKFGLTTEVDLVSPIEYSNDTIYKLPRLDANDIPKNLDVNPFENEWY